MFREYFRKNSSRILIGSIIVLLLSLFIVGYPISDIYNRNFLPQSEKVTELYFTSPDSLPRAVTPKIPTQFTFHVTNQEDGPITYSYLVTIQTPGTSAQTITSGSFTLADGNATEVPVKFSISQPGARSLVTVLLIGRPETIHFWVNS